MVDEGATVEHASMTMHPDAIALLSCPHCGGGLVAAPRSLRCAQGHVFDIARQGYVNLLPRRPRHTGDSAEMVAARVRAQSSGALEPVTHGLVAAAQAAMPPGGALLDVGAGPGHHTAAVLDALPGAVGLALDASVYAARRAARAHPRLLAAVCDAWSAWPVRDHAVGVVASVFAPRNLREVARVLRDDGAFVVVTPAPDHLRELVEPLGLVRVDPHKTTRLTAELARDFRLAATAVARAAAPLTRPVARDLAAMGPSAHHLDDDALTRRAAALPEPLDVTVSVEVRTFRPSGAALPRPT